jgi:pyrophosphatase PpaX
MTHPHIAPRRPVLFDLDGTLADTIPLLLASMHAAYDSVGGTAPDDRVWLRGMGTPLRAQFLHFEGHDLARVEALIAVYREWQIANLTTYVTAYDGIHALLEALQQRAHPIAVVTGKGQMMARMTLAQVDLLTPFSVIIGAENSSRHKPDPDPLLVGAKALGVAPAGALYIGDAPNDILAARAAGMIDVWAAWGPFRDSEIAPFTPSYTVQSPAEILALLESLDARADAAIA